MSMHHSCVLHFLGVVHHFVDPHHKQVVHGLSDLYHLGYLFRLEVPISHHILFAHQFGSPLKVGENYIWSSLKLPFALERRFLDFWIWRHGLKVTKNDKNESKSYIHQVSFTYTHAINQSLLPSPCIVPAFLAWEILLYNGFMCWRIQAFITAKYKKYINFHSTGSKDIFLYCLEWWNAEFFSRQARLWKLW